MMSQPSGKNVIVRVRRATTAIDREKENAAAVGVVTAIGRREKAIARARGTGGRATVNGSMMESDRKETATEGAL